MKLAGFTDAASKETQPEELDYLKGMYGSIDKSDKDTIEVSKR
jgi:hypothetical protein